MKKAHLSQNEAIDFNGLVQPQLFHEFIKKAVHYADMFILTTNVNEHENNITSLADFKKSKWGYLTRIIVDYEFTRKSPLGQGPKQMLICFRFDPISLTSLNQPHEIIFSEFDI